MIKSKSADFVSPRDLIRRARSNLIRSRQEKPAGVLREDLCFNAHQAAEKALKAVCLEHDISYRFAHDLGDLIACLENKNIFIPEQVEQSAQLSEYALPVLSCAAVPPDYVSAKEHQQAVDTAREVFRWASNQLEEELPVGE
ncbi:MAG: HEPN domain-containing protein [bacterium]